jgi:Ca2+-binding EF-hand superfamily protein
MRELIGQGTSGLYTERGGKIDFDLFCNLMTRKVKDVNAESELKDAFRVLDEDGKGYIGCNELRQICKNLGEDLDDSEVFDMVSEALSNFDGKIYYDGLKKIMLPS